MAGCGGLLRQEELRRLNWNEKAGLFVQDVVVGGGAAGMTKSVSVPLQNAKILLAVPSVSLQVSSMARYQGMVTSLLREIREKGFRALWRGNGDTLLRYLPIQSLNFAFNDVFRQLFIPGIVNRQSRGRLDYVLRNMASGGVAGAATVLALYPLDLARLRITNQVATKSSILFVGPRDCLRQVYATEGICGLYQGVGVSLCGAVSYRAVYFGGYESAKRFVLSDSPSRVDLFLTALMTTFSAHIIANPIDTVRLHMGYYRGGSTLLYTSHFDCIRTIWRQSKATGFYRGFFVSSLRSFGGAFSLVLFDEITKHSKFSLA